MKKYTVTVGTVTGAVYDSQVIEATEEEFSNYLRTIQNINDLTSFYITVNTGGRVYFNPDHIVTVTAKEL